MFITLAIHVAFSPETGGHV